VDVLKLLVNNSNKNVREDEIGNHGEPNPEKIDENTHFFQIVH